MNWSKSNEFFESLNEIPPGIGKAESLYPTNDSINTYYLMFESSTGSLMFGECIKTKQNSILILMSNFDNEEYKNKIHDDIKNMNPNSPKYYIKYSDLRNYSNTLVTDFSTMDEYDINDNKMAAILNDYICNNQTKTINNAEFNKLIEKYLNKYYI
jgi:hypothetical protein